ncbi:hypothetical protein [Rathayibacter sp. VKM Ac-2801]|uniref:hypothetical protein n=1 Tax=Rathayibacter sp. VKM Ac-2801 TaxID=2609255 RepID=UPI0013201FC5|nr:hypothetical protein [Rathayibacter sp. VKM Ac-2801]QHC71663.1 hypothetical protein GSU45_15570 [Rathayibacter sp. VKM Ac-2801]
MAIDEATDGIELRRLRSRMLVARQSYQRELRRAAEDRTPTELARLLRVAQTVVEGDLREAAAVPDVRSGFSGGTPYEIAQRFAAGELTREQAVDELGRWRYRPGSPSDGFDWTTLDPGGFEEVRRALSDGLLDDAMYDEILDRYIERVSSGERVAFPEESA